MKGTPRYTMFKKTDKSGIDFKICLYFENLEIKSGFILFLAFPGLYVLAI